MVGLLVGGVLVGPYALGWVAAGSTIDRLGNVGILYLMFLAGLEFSFRTFRANRRTALVFGALGFAVPFVLSVWVSTSWVGLGILGASLVGAMWASNTLVAYPEAQEAGLAETRAVGSAVAGGVIADLSSLTVLAVVSSVAADLAAGESAQTEAALDIPVWITLPVLSAVSLLLVPRLAQWFFVRVGHTRTERFVFTLAAMGAASLLAEVGGVAGLIGAFLVGLGLNRLVPTHGPLFESVEFVGTAIFVPAFLVSIGFTIDPRLLFDVETLSLAVLFTALVVVGKLAAAAIVGIGAKLPLSETGIMATLSMGQAASTLAIARIGVEYEVLEQNVANAAVLAIVATAFITSYGTRFFARRVEAEEEARPPLGKRLMVDVRATGGPVEEVMQVAAAVVAPDGGLLVPFAVAPAAELDDAKSDLERAVSAALETGQDAVGAVRLDDSFTDGVLQLSAEREASLLVLGWEGPGQAVDRLFGSELDRIGERATTPTMAIHVAAPWRRVVVVPGRLGSSARSSDAELALTLAKRIARRRKSRVHLHAAGPAQAAELAREGDGVVVTEVGEGAGPVTATDLLVLPAHAFRDLPELGARRRGPGPSMAVVAGARRLHLTSRAVARHVHGAVGGSGAPGGLAPA
jgi:Kef-type K+ transport system membrane component KefB